MIKITLLLLTALLTFARADVIVVDPGKVLIAGANVGKISDACANYPDKIAELQAAIETYVADLIAAKQAAEQKLAETVSFSASLVTRAKEAASKGDLKTLGVIITDASTPEAERKRAELEAQKTKLDEQKAALDAQIAELPK